MSATAIISALEIINASLGVIKLLSDVGVDVTRLIAMQNHAAQEGRELSPEELQSLATRAQGEIDKLQNMGEIL